MAIKQQINALRTGVLFAKHCAEAAILEQKVPVTLFTVKEHVCSFLTPNHVSSYIKKHPVKEIITNLRFK